MSTEENKALIRLIIEEALNNKNLSLLDEHFSPDYIMYAHGGEGLKGLEAFKQFITLFTNAFPDFHQTINDIIAEGDKVTCRITLTGTHTGSDFMGKAPTGKHFTYSAIAIYRIAGGKCTESWIESDRLGHMQQLGIIPSK